MYQIGDVIIVAELRSHYTAYNGELLVVLAMHLLTWIGLGTSFGYLFWYAKSAHLAMRLSHNI